MLVSDTPLEGQVFGKVLLAGCADVADVTKSACKEFGWGAPTQVGLHRVREGRGKALAIEADPSLAADILVGANKLAADEAVEPGSWLLARLPPPPAAAPGASRRHAGVLARSHPHTLSASCRRRAGPSRALPSRRSSLLPLSLLSSRAAPD